MAHSSSIEALFEDQHLLVLLKPAGLLSQGDASEDPSLVDLLRERFGRHYVGLIHRLDRNTSGLMVVAKRSKSAERLTNQLQKGNLVRKYHALVSGRMTEPCTLTHFLLKNEKTNEVKVVREGSSPDAKIAVLHAHPLKTSVLPDRQVSVSWIEITLETGRSHQIRVQCTASGFPLLGDSKYAPKEIASLFWRPALHSAYLRFEHPMSQEVMTFQHPCPQDLFAQYESHVVTGT